MAPYRAVYICVDFTLNIYTNRPKQKRNKTGMKEMKRKKNSCWIYNMSGTFKVCLPPPAITNHCQKHSMLLIVRTI